MPSNVTPFPASQRKSWYRAQINPTNANEAEISIYDEIGFRGVTAIDFKNSLNELGEVSVIRLGIHSPGGSVFEAFAIYNMLRAHKASVQVRIDGLAASAASVIAMAGDYITIPANAYLMIHAPRTVAMGESDEMRKQADLLDKIRDSIADIYAARANMTREEAAELMADETWMNGNDAVALGFADEVLPEQKVAAKMMDAHWARHFAAVPMDISPAADDDGAAEPAEEPPGDAGSPAPSADDGTDGAAGDPPPADDPEGDAAAGSEEAGAETEAEPENAGADAPSPADGAAPPQSLADRLLAWARGDDRRATALADARAEIASQAARIAELEGEIGELTAKAARLTEVEAALAKAEAESRSAIDLAAAQGIPADQAEDLPPPGSGEPAGTVLEQYEALRAEGAPRAVTAAFYAQHKDEILKLKGNR